MSYYGYRITKDQYKRNQSAVDNGLISQTDISNQVNRGDFNSLFIFLLLFIIIKKIT